MKKSWFNLGTPHGSSKTEWQLLTWLQCLTMFDWYVWPAWKCFCSGTKLELQSLKSSQIYLSYFQHPAVLEAGSMKDSSTSFSAFKRSCTAGYHAVAFHRAQMSSVCWNFGTEQVFNKFHESNYNSPEPNDCKDGTLGGLVISPVIDNALEMWSSSMVIIHWFTQKVGFFQINCSRIISKGDTKQLQAQKAPGLSLTSLQVTFDRSRPRTIRNPLGPISKWELPHLMAN